MEFKKQRKKYNEVHVPDLPILSRWGPVLVYSEYGRLPAQFVSCTPIQGSLFKDMGIPEMVHAAQGVNQVHAEPFWVYQDLGFSDKVRTTSKSLIVP